MFEEVPRVRRGLGRLSGYRLVLGPFAVGGVLLAMVGGSVAVAATVITASSIVINDVPTRPHQAAPVVASSSQPAHPGQSSKAGGGHSSGATSSSTAGPVQTVADPARPVQQPASTPQPGRSAPRTTAAIPSRSSIPSSTASPSAPGSSPVASSSSPVGNALIYLTGYDQASGRLRFQYAEMKPGAGAGGSDLYLVSNPASYSATVASGISIVSGGQLCPPAGSSCTPAQLIAAAGSGVFAEVAIDSFGQLRSVIERDNATATAQPSPSATQGLAMPSTTGSPAPTPSPSG